MSYLNIFQAWHRVTLKRLPQSVCTAQDLCSYIFRLKKCQEPSIFIGEANKVFTAIRYRSTILVRYYGACFMNAHILLLCCSHSRVVIFTALSWILFTLIDKASKCSGIASGYGRPLVPGAQQVIANFVFFFPSTVKLEGSVCISSVSLLSPHHSPRVRHHGIFVRPLNADLLGDLVRWECCAYEQNET